MYVVCREKVRSLALRRWPQVLWMVGETTMVMIWQIKNSRSESDCIPLKKSRQHKFGRFGLNFRRHEARQRQNKHVFGDERCYKKNADA